MGNLGFYLLLLSSILCAYAAIAQLGAALTRHRALWRSGRAALTMSLASASGAALLMWIALFNRDFSLQYVFRNSSTDLPPIYTLTAFWSSLEGSHMLWTLLLNLYAVIAVWIYAKANEHIMPYISAVLASVLAWMFFLAITHSDLFALSNGSQPEGMGMNTLLQNPYMAIHPPLLFTGYTTLAIPFAYSIAALIYGDITEGWLKTVRRWTLLAWTVLTAAIILGGRWAYVELGWAGYWAWDPVENSSLLPWLLATAFLHGLIIQGQIGHLKRLNLAMAILAFFLTFFGTFITRSGVITSVHSFASSPIGPAYLGFLAVLLAASALLFGSRAHTLLPPDATKAWGVSRESALVLGILLVLSFAAIVFVGTIFPIASEALTQRRISIQAPYFNSFAPYFGFATVCAIAAGNLLRFQSGKIPHVRRTLILTSFFALVATLFVSIQFGLDWAYAQNFPMRFLVQFVGIFLIFWCAACLIADQLFRLETLRWNYSLMWSKNRASLGAFVAHIGALMIIFGFMGNYRGQEQEINLEAGQSRDVFGYQFLFEESGMLVGKEGNVTLYKAPLTISRDGTIVEKIYPARSQYPTSQDLMHEVALSSSLWRDIYVVLRDFRKTDGKNITLQININPTVRFVWIATIVLVLGGLLALSDAWRGDRTRDALMMTGRVLLVGFFCVAIGMSLNASPSPLTTMTPEQQDHFRSIAGQLRCPTCTGLSVLDSDAAFSLQIQSLVREQIAEGKSEDEIMNYFVDRYGAWIMREPPKKGFDLLAWIFPIALIILAPAFFVVRFWRTPQQVTANTQVRSTQNILEEFEFELNKRRGNQAR